MPDAGHFTGWKPLRIGAGGWLVGMDIAADGTMVVRADTYGAYVWDDTHWRQLVTADSMPAADVQALVADGVYEIRIAPNDSQRLYLMYLGGVFRSDDRGHTWVRTAFTPVVAGANDPFRMRGPRLGVQPDNADVVLVGTPADGLFRTNDAGATWSHVDAVPTSNAVGDGHPGITGLAFDGATAFASSFGHGVYRDDGSGFVKTTGGPASVTHAKLATDGAYYAADLEGQKVWRWSSGTWTDITPRSAAWTSVVTDPFDPAHVVAVQEGGGLTDSVDRGGHWQTRYGGATRTADDVPWLAWTNESWMSVGDLYFDPLVPKRLWFAEGIGVWSADLPPDAATPVAWHSRNAGIEQLVANAVLSVPGGAPLAAAWDRPVFRLPTPDAYPTEHGPNRDHAIVHGWALDYASSDPSFVVGIMNNVGVDESGFSTDGGRTWSAFATVPAADGALGGSIAASTPRDIVWIPTQNHVPFVTHDGGATWKPLALQGVPTSGETGWGTQYTLNRHVAVADRVQPATFYVYNYLKGLYRSTDAGETWTLQHAGEIIPISQYNAILQGGRAGELYFTAGSRDYPGATHPADEPFLHSTDGGATWTELPTIREVRTFGLGAPKQPGGPPCVYAVGWVSGAYGVYRSDDAGQTWTSLGAYPLGSLDQIKAVSGDANEYGKAYVGFVGSGFAYYTP